MGPLRKAGKAFLDFDEAYAKKIESSLNPHKQPLRGMTSGVSIRDIIKGQKEGRADSQVEKLLGAGMTAGVFAANVGSRYALPAGGVTLAGKALIDLTAAYGSAADQPEPMTLSM